MQISGKFRGKTALFLSSTVGLALTLAGCTSVEYTAKEGPDGPKIATVAPSAATGNTPATATPETAQAAAPAGTTAAPATTTATADASLAQQQPALPNVAAVKGGRVALPPAAEIAAAAAIANQMQPTAETQVAQTSTMPAAQTTTVALAPTTATPAVAAVNAAAQSTHPTAGELPQVVAVKGSFPPAPPPPGSPSIGTELTTERKVIPLPKPDSTVLAYAAGPTNAALAAVNASGTMTAPLNPSPAGRDKLSGLISKYAAMYQVPEDLVHRVVQRESRYNPAAYNGGHFGLMQIKHATARSMGFDGPASGLFDAETNLRYAVKYLRGAWLVADNDRDNAVRLYARGYYYDAKRKGMLHVLRK